MLHNNIRKAFRFFMLWSLAVNFAQADISINRAKPLHCGSDAANASLMRRAPENALKNPKFATIEKKSANSSSSYIIPVVFHIFGTEHNGKTVTDAIIKEGLQKTNEDFQGLTADWADVPLPFADIKQTLDIEFKLPTLDPEGRPTSGILYHPLESGFGNDLEYDNRIREYAWDNYKYMNVYVMNDLYGDNDCCNSGVAWFPNVSMSDNNTARVVYNGAYIGSNTNENFRSVLTHEFGHWLNLRHTFSGGCSVTNESACADTGDLICDTPQVDNSGINTADELNCLGQVTNWQNFMAYSDDYAMFTQDQVERMLAALSHPSRITLWQADNLAATGVSANPITGIAFSKNSFDESFDNDGSFRDAITLNIIGNAEFAITSGTLSGGIDYTITGVPEGMSSSLTISNNSTATLHLTGNALTHESVNNQQLILEFLDSSIAGGTSLLSNPVNTLSLHFKDAYTQYSHSYPESSETTYAHIRNVSIGSIDHLSSNEQYRDFSSRHITNVVRGQNYPLSITLEAENAPLTDTHRIRIWIDWNGDYVYNSNELVTSHNAIIGNFDNNSYTYNTTVTVPPDASLTHPIGMRVLVHFVVNSTDGETPYGLLNSGESIDYGINVLDESLPLIAEFAASNTHLSDLNRTITFTDESFSNNGDITIWQWSFPGGEPSSHNGQTPPTVTYNSAGNYEVSLTITSSDNQTAVNTKQAFIHVYEDGTALNNGDLLQNLTATVDTERRYYIDVPANAHNLIISTTSADDADLYVKYGERPTADVFDCRPWESDGNESCDESTFGPTQAGRYHIMVLAFSAYNDLTLSVSYDEITGDGDGDGDGDGELLSGVPVLDIATNQNLNYFITLPQDADSLSINLDTVSGDPDIYVGYEYIPLGENQRSDCFSFNQPGSIENCTFSPAIAGTYHILVSPYRGSYYTANSLVATYTLQGNQISERELINNIAVTDIATSYDMRFFIDVPDFAESLTVNLETIFGDPDLYIGFEYQPLGENEANDCKSYEISGQAETCTISPVNAGRYHILVDAYGGSYYTASAITATYTPVGDAPQFPRDSLLLRPNNEQAGNSFSIGAIAAGDQQYKNDFTVNDAIDIYASISMDSNSVGQSGQLFVVILYAGQWFMIDSNGTVHLWDFNMNNLLPFSTMTSFRPDESFYIRRALSGLRGEFHVFVGYQVTGGEIYYNMESFRLTVN